MMKKNAIQYFTALSLSISFIIFGISHNTLTGTAEEKVKWKSGVNDWGFTNSSENMGTDFYLNEQDRYTLYSHLKNTEKFAVNKSLNNPWYGACYGFALTSVLSCYGVVPYQQYAFSSDMIPDCLNHVGFPLDSHKENGKVPADVRSLLNSYFLLQATDAHRQISARQMYRYTEEERTRMLVELAEQEIPSVVSFFYFGEDRDAGREGHAIVVYGAEDCSKNWEGKSYNKRLLIYDPNLRYKDQDEMAQKAIYQHGNLYVNTKDWSWCLPYYGSSANGANLSLILSDPASMNQGGTLPGPLALQEDEPFIGVLTTNKLHSSYQLLKAQKSEKGLAIQDKADFKVLDNFYPDNVESSVMNYLTEDIDDAYILHLDNTQETEMVMYYENSIQRVNSSQMQEGTVAPNGYAGFIGKYGAYSLEIITNENFPTQWYDVTVSGTAEAAALSMQENGYLLRAKDLNGIEITVQNLENVQTKQYATEADAILFCENADGELTASVDLDGNGSYETRLAEQFMPGDVNLDGHVNAKDATEVLIAAARIGTGQDLGLTDSGLKAADVNQDGKINAVDATWILQYAAAIGTGSNVKTIDEFISTRSV